MAYPCWLYTSDALDKNNNPVVIRFSDGDYIDGSANPYPNRMLAPGLVMVSPNDGGVLDVFADASVGEIELDNVDGRLNYLNDYAIDGRDCKLEYFDGVSVLSPPYFTGTNNVIRSSGDSIYIQLRTLKDLLETDHTFDKFLGNNSLPNGVEGVAGDLLGVEKPRSYGANTAIAPKLVNTSKLIYQACSRSNTSIANVYDRGVLFTKGANYTSVTDMVNNAPAAGTVRCFQGYFRLNAQPVGTVTCDTTDVSNLAGNVFKSICDERSIATDTSSITALNAAGNIGVYYESLTTTASMLNEICKGTGFAWYFINNTIYLYQLALALTSEFDLHEWQYEGSPSKDASGLGSNGLPIGSLNVKFDKVLTVQKDLAGNVPAATVSRLAEEYRKKPFTNATTLTRHKLAKTIDIESCLKTESEVTSAFTNFFNLISSKVDVISVTAYFKNLPALRIGQGFTLFSDFSNYLELVNGKRFTIVAFEKDNSINSVKIKAIG